jgi:hypothetical protein
MDSSIDTSAIGWKTRRTTGIRIVIASAGVLFATFMIYSRVNGMVISSETSRLITEMAVGTLSVLLITLVAIGFGFYRIYNSEKWRVESTNEVNSTASIIMKALNDKRHFNIFKFSTIAYGMFYAFITGLFVYRPNEIFSEIYGAQIPSWQILPCCGNPGYIPVFVAYITEQFGVLLIPLNLILLFITSVLVGVNTALAVYAFHNRPKNANANWFVGFGIFTGLFTGCPTCAGTFFATIFGIGIGTSALALAPLQSLFIAISIPVLLITPLLIARSTRNSLCDGCSRDS